MGAVDPRERLLRFLAAGPAECTPAAGGRVHLESSRLGSATFERALLTLLLREQLIEARGSTVALSRRGVQCRAELRQRRDALGPGPGDRELTHTQTPGADGPIVTNISESPLAQLARRRSRGGAPFLSQKEFAAGERLRADYTRGLLMPRTSANWDAAISLRRRDASGAAELTQASLAARQRVEAALRTVGPELTGILVDVCCFLKGLETVEAERIWPARSAKVVLKTALAALARHYAPAQEVPSQRRVFHWGTPDYRPEMAGTSARCRDGEVT